MQKIMAKRSSLSITIKDASTIMRSPSLHIQTKGYTHVLVSLTVILRELLVAMIFHILYPNITSVNDFCTVLVLCIVCTYT